MLILWTFLDSLGFNRRIVSGRVNDDEKNSFVGHLCELRKLRRLKKIHAALFLLEEPHPTLVLLRFLFRVTCRGCGACQPLDPSWGVRPILDCSF